MEEQALDAAKFSAGKISGRNPLSRRLEGRSRARTEFRSLALECGVTLQIRHGTGARGRRSERRSEGLCSESFSIR